MADTIKSWWLRFRASSMMVQLIVINVAVFVLLRVAVIIAIFSGSDLGANALLSFVQVPSSPLLLLQRPWTVLTYMFAQYDVLHLLFNMIFLYWFGMLFLNIASGRTLLALYIYGGLAGALLFVAAGSAWSALHAHTLIGSSAAVMAIVTATAVRIPDFRLNLMFIGPVALKWIALVFIGLALLGVAGENAGGDIAHIGGIAAGAAYALLLRRGTDITRPALRLFSAVEGMFHRNAPSAPRDNSRRRTTATDTEADRRRLDEILDKIKRSGYTSLTAEERALLFDISNREKNRQ